MGNVDPDAPMYRFPDEVPEILDIGTYGWKETDEAHGYCTFCGHHGHIRTDCEVRPLSKKAQADEAKSTAEKTAQS